MRLTPNSESLREYNACHAPDSGKFCSGKGDAFDTWFAGSKVTNFAGKPLRVYHGTAAEDFDSFTRAAGLSSGTESDMGIGHFFAQRPSEADEFASGSAQTDGWSTDARRQRLVPVYLAIRNPKRYETQKEFFTDIRTNYDYHREGSGVAARLALMRQGYDGVVIEDSQFGYPRRDSGRWFIAFHARQIKSAISNRGTWSRTSRSLTEFNACHAPGSGKFCSAPDAGRGGGASGHQPMLAAYSVGTQPHPFNNRERLTAEMVGTELYTRGPNVRISAIATYGARGQGAGTRALQQILTLADQHGVTLELGAKPFASGGRGKALTAAQLKKWYAKHGFVPARGAGGGEMVRTPKG